MSLDWIEIGGSK